MLNVDHSPVAAATATIVLCDCLALFLEVESVGHALTALEQQHGSSAELQELRQRQQYLRVTTLAKLYALLPKCGQEIVH